MKSRHAAALALVGWYLMAPSAGQGSAPLSKWRQLGRFDSAAQCQQMIVDLVHDTDAKVRTEVKAWHTDKAYGTGNSTDNAHMDRVLHDIAAQYGAKNAKCIATDDPRLKESGQ